MNFRLVDLSAEEIAQQLSVVEPLTDSVRGLIDAVIRTEVDDDELNAAREQIDAIVARLRTKQKPGSFGVQFTRELSGLSWGNAAVGARNGIAPPMRIVHHEDGRATCDVELGAAYEGPGGLVHGGVSAMLIDQLLGEAASVGNGLPCFTGTLTVKYLRPTPLGPLSMSAETVRREGRKIFVRGEICTADGPTVTAEAIMVSPKELPSRDQIMKLRAELAAQDGQG
ncbi:PaaI family thioesterase [Gordonia neofelifaecis]|uniref:Acyl-coenzyme A thioesterase THEM4 n=1 Tax=Gordonia neofelifaecis NRRL B-59395 TaxID=644548 RepID=F1YM52_9ACTN|nr:PaaI family thioesterase [Gordonia neofelifaecis]EGD54303.1 thioesterase superfamily protein [Gordonia neofelifaecis NRRL B-59395]